jgi:hypothetical protein
LSRARMSCLKAVLLGVVLLGAAGVCEGARVWHLDPLANFSCGTTAGCAILATGGYNGGPAVSLTSTPSTSAAISNSGGVPAAALQTFMVSAAVKCTRASSSGTAYIGAAGQHIDLNGVVGSGDLGNGWTRYNFVQMSGAGSSLCKVGLGVWEVDGTCLFSDITLAQVEVRAFGSAQYGPLGRRESVTETGLYASALGGSSELANYHRQLVAMSGGYFNSNRYVFSGGSYLVLDHSLPVGFLQPATVQVTVSYYTQGSLVVTSSTDGTTWSAALATIASETTVSVQLPSVAHKFVKLEATASSTIQVNSYLFTANVMAPADGEPVRGKDAILVIVQDTPSVTLSILGGVAPVAGSM